MRSKGTLDVRVRGNTLIPSTLLGRFWILCAILRQLHLILQICLLSNELRDLRPQSFFVDQLSAGIPLLRLLRPDVRVIFYCHFPDKLLARNRGLVKSVYRWPFDWLESWSTGCSDAIVVNSNFTKGVFKDAFPRLRNRQPGVVYPCVDTANLSRAAKEPLWEGKKLFVSVNRFERKKDVGLAIIAFARLTDKDRQASRLVIAGMRTFDFYWDRFQRLILFVSGGYDRRNTENSSYHDELVRLAESLGLKHATMRAPPTALAVPDDISVLFLLSVPSDFKNTLLASADLLLYTPLHEHFGIVPLESMLARTPVLAASEGGPVETVVEGVTGWLRDVHDVEAWTKVMRSVLTGIPYSKLQEMGEAGRRRVVDLFSKGRMARALQDEIDAMQGTVRRPRVIDNSLQVSLCAFAIAIVVVFIPAIQRVVY